MNCVKFDTEPRQLHDFLALSHRLYCAGTDMQNDGELRALLCGTHPLSKYFTLHKFCVYDGTEIVGRFAVTIYPDDDTAYLGFFECLPRDDAAREIFSAAEQFARSLACRRLVGPVDASFWLRYRLKINHFDRPPYTGEPYNLAYYPRLFAENGFAVREHYTSSPYSRVEADFCNETYAARLRAFTERGYEIRNLSLADWDTEMAGVYRLISQLYSDFPVYKPISAPDFAALFAGYRRIVNTEMVKLAYFQGALVGFFISVPDYGNAVYHAENPLRLLKILSVRRRPKQYVMLYMGVAPEHRGLGKALVQSIIGELQQSGLPSIGALQRDGKITQNYVAEKIGARYEYALYGKELCHAAAPPDVPCPCGLA